MLPRLATIFAVLVFTAATVSNAEARTRRDANKPRDVGTRYDTSTWVERERADHVDPSRRFGNYPAWARIAFSQERRRH